MCLHFYILKTVLSSCSVNNVFFLCCFIIYEYVGGLHHSCSWICQQNTFTLIFYYTLIAIFRIHMVICIESVVCFKSFYIIYALAFKQHICQLENYWCVKRVMHLLRSAFYSYPHFFLSYTSFNSHFPSHSEGFLSFVPGFDYTHYYVYPYIWEW